MYVVSHFYTLQPSTSCRTVRNQERLTVYIFCVWLTFGAVCVHVVTGSSVWSWRVLSPLNSDKTPGRRCTHTSNPAPASAASHQRLADEDSRPTSCVHTHIHNVQLFTYCRTITEQLLFGFPIQTSSSHSAVLKAFSKLALRSYGSRVQYSNPSGKNRCTRAQNARPSAQLDEKLCMFTPWHTNTTRLAIERSLRNWLASWS